MKKETEKILAKIEEIIKTQEELQIELHTLRIELLQLTTEESLQNQEDASKADTNLDICLDSIFTVEFLAKNEEKRNLITRVCNCLAKYGYKSLGDIAKSSMADLYNMRNGGVNTTAFILIMCEHYGINLNEGYEKYVQLMGRKTWDKTKKRIEEQKELLGNIYF